MAGVWGWEGCGGGGGSLVGGGGASRWEHAWWRGSLGQSLTANNTINTRICYMKKGIAPKGYGPSCPLTSLLFYLDCCLWGCVKVSAVDYSGIHPSRILAASRVHDSYCGKFVIILCCISTSWITPLYFLQITQTSKIYTGDCLERTKQACCWNSYIITTPDSVAPN